MTALPIRQDYSPSELRRLAGREPDRRAALRLLAVANALEGMPRAEAARLAGMERQALRDAVLRFNAAGPAGLHDKPRSGRPERLSAGQQAALKAHVLRGPAPERDGVSAWRRRDSPESWIDPTSTEWNYVEQVRHCRKWLAGQERCGRIINDRQSSYGLKHRVERDVGSYVCNGAFLIACLMEGVLLKRSGPDSFSAYTNLSSKAMHDRREPA